MAFGSGFLRDVDQQTSRALLGRGYGEKSKIEFHVHAAGTSGACARWRLAGGTENAAAQNPVGGASRPAGQGLKPIRPWGFSSCGRCPLSAGTHTLATRPPPLIPQRPSRPSPVPSLPPSPIARLFLPLLSLHSPTLYRPAVLSATDCPSPAAFIPFACFFAQSPLQRRVVSRLRVHRLHPGPAVSPSPVPPQPAVTIATQPSPAPTESSL